MSKFKLELKYILNKRDQNLDQKEKKTLNSSLKSKRHNSFPETFVLSSFVQLGSLDISEFLDGFSSHLKGPRHKIVPLSRIDHLPSTSIYEASARLGNYKYRKKKKNNTHIKTLMLYCRDEWIIGLPFDLFQTSRNSEYTPLRVNSRALKSNTPLRSSHF